MEKTEIEQICFTSKDGLKLLCNAVDRYGDGQLWATKSGKWIPITLELVKGETATTSKR